jgi:hypothetical protein
VIDPEDVISRLHSLSVPVDDDVAARHLDSLSTVAPTVRHMRMRTLVGGGTLAVAMLAGTGIAAAAGNLPGPMQGAAHATLSKVGVDVPKERSTEGCNGKTYKNHGQFMKDQPKTGAARSAAAKSMCGKPINASTDADEDETTTPGASQDKGKPGNPGNKGAENKGAENKGTDTADEKKATPDAGQPETPGKSTAPGLNKDKGNSGK